jgi:hypothetical protein
VEDYLNFDSANILSMLFPSALLVESRNWRAERLPCKRCVVAHRGSDSRQGRNLSYKLT